MEGDATRVLIVDDHRSFADAVALAVNAESDLRCTGTAGTVEQAMDAINERGLTVVLVDIALPDGDGITLTAHIKRQRPELRVLIITGSTEPVLLAMAARAGADGFLRKDQPLADVLEAIRDPAGELLTSPQILNLIVREGVGRVRESSPIAEIPTLTDREQEVLARLAQGEPVKAIARGLEISVFTCRGHVRSILEKLGVHSQLAAVVRSSRLGMIPAQER